MSTLTDKHINRLGNALLILIILITASTIWDSYTLHAAVQIEEGAQ